MKSPRVSGQRLGTEEQFSSSFLGLSLWVGKCTYKDHIQHELWLRTASYTVPFLPKLRSILMNCTLCLLNFVQNLYISPELWKAFEKKVVGCTALPKLWLPSRIWTSDREMLLISLRLLLCWLKVSPSVHIRHKNQNAQKFSARTTESKGARAVSGEISLAFFSPVSLSQCQI